MMEGHGWQEATMKGEVWQKDLKLIAAALREAGVPAPLFAACRARRRQGLSPA
jgi:3-hydroxyisobutyrate dehydrogenase-like beta-hydroxyacid dehydrogenase